MEGCINLFRAIDPGVRRIETYAGGSARYVLLARRPRSVVRVDHCGRHFGWAPICSQQ